MLSAGVLTLLEKMSSNFSSAGPATALYLNLSCLEEAKCIIGSSNAAPFLVQLLGDETEPHCRLDALHALYNLSTIPSNIPAILAAGVINGLQSLISSGNDAWMEKSIAVLLNLVLNRSARDEMVGTPGLISGLAAVLDTGEPVEQEQAVSCLLSLCMGDDKCCQMVLQEGVIPSLVSIQVNGTGRGREKAQKLLMLFREQRQRDQPSAETQPEGETVETSEESAAVSHSEPKPFCKSTSRRKVGKALGFLWKSKSYSVYQC